MLLRKNRTARSGEPVPPPIGSTRQPICAGVIGDHRASTILSFDDLVGAGEERPWKCQAEFLGGLEVDDQLEFCRLLHRKIGRWRALEDAVDVLGSAPGALSG